MGRRHDRDPRVQDALLRSPVQPKRRSGSAILARPVEYTRPSLSLACQVPGLSELLRCASSERVDGTFRLPHFRVHRFYWVRRSCPADLDRDAASAGATASKFATSRTPPVSAAINPTGTVGTGTTPGSTQRLATPLDRPQLQAECRRRSLPELQSLPASTRPPRSGR